jgi:hypothetical protein
MVGCMRVSIDDKDRGYYINAWVLIKNVYKNGVVLEDCLTADTDKGEAIVYVRDKNGDLMQDYPHNPDMLKRKIVYGNIGIEFYDGFSAEDLYR